MLKQLIYRCKSKKENGIKLAEQYGSIKPSRKIDYHCMKCTGVKRSATGNDNNDENIHSFCSSVYCKNVNKYTKSKDKNVSSCTNRQ